MNSSESGCYFAWAMKLLIIPSLLGIAMVPFYVVLWINYCQKLFQGINNTLQKLRVSSVDVSSLQKCHTQYNVLCGLIDNINQKYGILIAYYLFSTTFMLFTYGYKLVKSMLSGYEIPVDNFCLLLVLSIGSALLFYHSFGLQSELSIIHSYKAKFLPCWVTLVHLNLLNSRKCIYVTFYAITS